MKDKPLRYAHRLHLSFLLICMIPVLVTFLLYFFVVRQANEQSDKLHESLLDTIQADMDACFLSARNIESRLYIDSDVSALSYVNGEMQSNHAMPQIRLFQELNSLVLSNKFLNSIFIYYPNAHKIVSSNGNMDFSLYYSLYYDENCLPEKAMEELLESSHHYDIHILRSRGNSCQMVMLLSLPSDNDQNRFSTIGLVFSSSVLKKQIVRSTVSTSETRLFIWTAAGDLYNPIDGLSATESLPGKDSAGKTVRFQGEDVRISSRASSQANIRYLMVTPERLIHEDVRKLHFVIVLRLLLSILSGLLLSRHLTAQNYNPVEQLLSTIRSGTSRNDAEFGGDELEWANREVEQLYQNSINNEQLLRDSRRQMRDYCLLQLITRGNVERPELYGLQFSSTSFALVVLKVLEGPDLKETELALRTSLLRNLFEENIKPLYPVETLEWGDAAISLISLPNHDSGHLSAIREASEKVQTTVETSLHFSCSVLIGPLADSIPDIPAAYQSTCELEEYRDLLDTNLISASEIANLESRYDFSVDDEEKLKNAVSIGDETTAITLMKNVFDKNRKAKIGVDLYWCLVYTMAGVLLRGANNGGIQDAAGNLNLHAMLMNRKPGADMENAFEEIACKICSEIALSRTDTDGDRAFCMELEAYIREHFTDPDLNISCISPHFNLTPAYLSTRYKRQTGRSLLDLINNSRLDYAEELLRNGATVAEAAERSGFRDSGSLIRTFKKKKGITPGQIRQQST